MYWSTFGTAPNIQQLELVLIKYWLIEYERPMCALYIPILRLQTLFKYGEETHRPTFIADPVCSSPNESF